MVKCINFGKYNNQYKYILLYLLFALFNESLYEINYYGNFNGIKVIFIHNDDDKYIKNYTFIRRKIIGYLGTFISTIISMICNIIKMRKEQNQKNDKEMPTVGRISLIHDENKDNNQQKLSILFVLIIIFGWILEEQAIDKYEKTLSHLDFWMLELIIICYLNSKMFNIEIYRHQIFVLFFSIIPIIFKIITIILEMNDGDDGNYPYEKKQYLIPLGLLIYFLLITLKAYIIINIKMFMDVKYISSNTLLMGYGFIGTIFYSILGILSCISHIIQYSGLSYIYIEKENSFSDYYHILINSEANIIIAEIIVLILGMITSYFIKYYFMMIIKHLTPVHIVFLTPLFYFFEKLILLIYNIIYCSIKNDFTAFFNENEMKFIKEKFCLDILGDIFSFFGFLVYLEMIELNCCGLNYNLRNKIINRGVLELINIEDYISNNSPNGSFSEGSNSDINSINSANSLDNLIDITKNSIFNK